MSSLPHLGTVNGSASEHREFWKSQLEQSQWRSRLQNIPSTAVGIESRKGVCEFEIVAPLLPALRGLAGDSSFLVYAAITASLSACLNWYSGSPTVVVGSPMRRGTTNPPRFENALPIVTCISPQHSFREHLSNVRKVLIDAYTRQAYPVRSLISEFPELSSSGPMFDVAMSLPEIHDRMSDAGQAITIILRNEPSRLVMQANFESLIDPDWVRRMLRHLAEFLQIGIRNPDRSIGSIVPMEQGESADWVRHSTGACLAEQGRHVHELVEAWALRTPHALALSDGERQYTYEDLNETANRVATRLAELGAGPGRIFGVLTRRSLSMVVSWLAVLKTGSAFVPLDPNSPQARIREILSDASVRTVLCEAALHEGFSAGTECICVDDCAPATLATTPLIAAQPGDLAYLIYTSGSTGRPKGVCVPFAGLNNLVAWHRQQYDIRPSDRASQVAIPSFDAAIWEIWPYLASGASVHFAPDEVVLEKSDLIRWLAEQAITISFLPTPIATQLSELTSWPHKLALRRLLTGGDWLKNAPKKAMPFQFINHYGPTECSVVATSSEIMWQSDLRPPIGLPIANTRVYVLDPSLRQLPVEVAGEIYIGGLGVSRGYWKDPGFTAAKYSPDPFSPIPGARMFKTGDRGCRRSDGQIEFLGRLDRQVKVRGFRIESGEIERVLVQHPKISEAAVIADTNSSGETILTAYVVPKHRSANDPETRKRQVHRWRTLFDEELYHRVSDIPQDPDFNIAGWIDSYSGRLVVDTQMRDWVGDASERILSLQPQNVLEIGCGTGLILFRIAPRCTRYVATDFSVASMQYLRDRIGSLPQVELVQSEARDFSKLDLSNFDTVLLNSVVAYFPDHQYLLNVLEPIIAAIRSPGAIFIGDVRSLPLMEAFHASVEFEKAEAAASGSDVWGKALQRVRGDNELLLSPSFFYALRERFPRISHVSITLERGRHHNEMTCFRYHTVLWIGQPHGGRAESSWQDWNSALMSLDALEAKLGTQMPDVLGYRNVPNARVQIPVWLRKMLPGEHGAVREIRARLARRSEAIEPHELEELACKLNYLVDFSWSRHDSTGAFDVMFRRKESAVAMKRIPVFPEPDADSSRLAEYASDPLKSEVDAGDLRSHLREYLPAYMVPEALVCVAELPLTPAGKVDYKALSTISEKGNRRAKLAPPRTPVEHALTRLWTDFLHRPVSIHDDFFRDLGGHSLLAVQLMSRVRDEFRIEVPLRNLFESPTPEGLARHIETLRSRVQREELPLAPVRRNAESPLSLQQRRLWFLAQLYPHSTAYNIPFALRLIGNLDESALSASINSISQRHEILRTTFEIANGDPLQRIHSYSLLSVQSVDLGDAEIQKRILHISRPFELDRGPLWRFELIRVGPQDHIFALSFHHIVFDGWSLKVFLRELSACYNGFVNEVTPELPQLPIQYADYACWQSDWLRTTLLEQQMRYWKAQLTGMRELQLPADYNRPHEPRYSSGVARITIPQWVLARLQVLSCDNGATLFMTLLAAFQALLHLYSGQTDIVLAVPAANRDRVEIENLIGFFVNTLVIRADLSGDPSFLELLQRVRHIVLDAFANADAPFEKVVEMLQPRRDLRVNPLVQVLFALQDGEVDGLDFANLAAEPIQVETGSTRLDLEFHLWQQHGDLHGAMIYSRELFAEMGIAEMLNAFGFLLAEISSNPALPLSRWSLFSSDRSPKLISILNDRSRDFAVSDECLHTCVERQADATPSAIAVVCGERLLTYNELDGLANRVAHCLIESGIHPECRVAVCADPSIESLVAILGILKAGAAFVPMDPECPPERAAYLFENSDVSAALFQRVTPLPPPFSAAGRCGASLIDDLLSDATPHHNRPPSVRVLPGNLAYVMYTSGSTGTPKGVAVAHDSVVNVLQTLARRIDLGKQDRLLSLARLSFDIHVMEAFLPLITGGCVEFVARRVARDPEMLKERLEDGTITAMQATPSLWDGLISLGWQASASLRHIFSTAENLSPRLSRRLAESGAQLWNLYGPTETAIYASVEHASGDRDRATIGCVVSNARLYVLDDRGRPALPGARGELFIGGRGVARGYVGHPGLTAERFIPDPFSNIQGARMYRTGDSVRYFSDGRIEFLGRTDHQIKIRGYRIEPAEVELALESHPTVRNAVVVTEPDPTGGSGLRAYLVPAKGDLPTSTEFRRFLSQRLPDYMIPSGFMRLDQMPVTANGKIDRSKISTTASKALPVGRIPVARSGELERQLGAVWAEVLGIAEGSVGLDDSFFELGGHSLLLIPLQRILREKYGIQLEIVRFFQFPTIRELAAYLAGFMRDQNPLLPAHDRAGLRRRAMEAKANAAQVSLKRDFLGGES